jgi:hypothetical protein
LPKIFNFFAVIHFLIVPAQHPNPNTTNSKFSSSSRKVKISKCKSLCTVQATGYIFININPSLDNLIFIEITNNIYQFLSIKFIYFYVLIHHYHCSSRLFVYTHNHSSHSQKYQPSSPSNNPLPSILIIISHRIVIDK